MAPPARPSRGNRGRGRDARGGRGRGPTQDIRNELPQVEPFANSAGGEWNAHLSERFRGRSRFNDSRQQNLDNLGLDLSLNMDVRRYIEEENRIGASGTSDAWLDLEELPTSEEISIAQDQEIELVKNRQRGKWKSKEKYLKAHYGLLREDAVTNLREAVTAFRKDPDMQDNKDIHIYEKVHISGFTFAQMGIAARITFSTARANRRIIWGSTKRLTSGTIVALTPMQDKFVSKCTVAVVAARPLQGVESTPCEIDLFFGRADDIEVDPQEEWLMIEAVHGYYEASRHTLRALQKLSTENFPMSEYICSLTLPIEAPPYLHTKPQVRLSAAISRDDEKTRFENTDIINQWPSLPSSTLDQTQWDALQQMLTKRLAIIQGPPGTGKTYVSKIALQILVENRVEGDPPIIIAAQTNHALDQLLDHVSHFDPGYIRLGGRSTNPQVRQRALYEIRQKNRLPLIPGGLLGQSTLAHKKSVERIMEALEPLHRSYGQPFTAETLFRLGIVTQKQMNSLEAAAAQWVSADGSQENSMQIWLANALIPFQIFYAADSFGFEAEEDQDLEFEQLLEVEAEHGVNDEEDIEMLRGPWCGLSDPWTTTPVTAAALDKAKRELDLKDNLNDIRPQLRGAVYSIMQAKAKIAIRLKVREAAEEYNNAIKNLKTGKWERDAVLLKSANIIGLTTTGLSKYRPLIASLKPKVILIEEAAEVIEAPITAACVESLEHLILVGDHQQLQGHCNTKALEGEPFYLNVSMFERLVRNTTPYKTLLSQRRMNPEFRELLTPLYPTLQDHPHVVQRPPLDYGMGDKKCFFLDRDFPEDKDQQMSAFNDQEAEFIAGFYKYLLRNGMHPTEITILTFYHGQRKRILRYLRDDSFTKEWYNNVKTVDSYQGEENEIVLLSLVRNNPENRIGFLSIDNRVCVALSRAKQGFFFFGNSRILEGGSELWSSIISIIRSRGQLGDALPICCKKHGRTVLLHHAQEWQDNDGGCFEDGSGGGDGYQDDNEWQNPARGRESKWANAPAGGGWTETTDTSHRDLFPGSSSPQAWVSQPLKHRRKEQDLQQLPTRPHGHLASRGAGPGRALIFEIKACTGRPSSASDNTTKSKATTAFSGYKTSYTMSTAQSSPYSKQLQDQSKQSWSNFATGGVYASDQAISRKAEALRVLQENEAKEHTACLIDFNENHPKEPLAQTKDIGKGRTKWVGNYQPSGIPACTIDSSEDGSPSRGRDSHKAPACVNLIEME